VRVRTIAGVPFVFGLRAGLFSVELLVENFFKLDHFGGVVWGCERQELDRWCG
jgi:hypothetical protein